MSNYYYLDIQLILQNPEEVTAAFFKKNIVEAVKQLFGEIGAAIPIDVLKFNPQTLEGIIRVPSSHYIKVRGSLTLCGWYEAIIMSHCRRLGQNGKDVVIFATKEDHSIPSKIALPPPDPQPGLILANGEINWNCPCLGGMATGPCGVQFRDAFSCFHHSKADPKGSDCLDKFKTMQNCMQKYPTLYNKELSEEEEMSSMAEAEQTADELITAAEATGADASNSASK